MIRGLRQTVESAGCVQLRKSKHLNKSIEKEEQGSSRRFIAIGKETTDSICKNGNSDFILGKIF